jgi:hypothetical protein
VIYLIVHCRWYFRAGMSNTREMNDYIGAVQSGDPIDRLL